jgi:hypothetical protein
MLAAPHRLSLSGSTDQVACRSSSIVGGLQVCASGAICAGLKVYYDIATSLPLPRLGKHVDSNENRMGVWFITAEPSAAGPI